MPPRCKASTKALLKWTIDRFARKVPGVHCAVEPKTHEVLLGQFSEAQCRKLFPKVPSKERSKAIKEMVDELDAIRALIPGAERDSRTCCGCTDGRTEHC